MIDDPSNFLVSTQDLAVFSLAVEYRELHLLVAYFVFLLETVQTALTGANVYYWFVIGFGRMECLSNINFSAIVGQTMSAPVSLIVQGYYCYRIWVLKKQWWLLSVVIAFVWVFPSVVWPIPILKIGRTKLSLSQAIASVSIGITVGYT
jgi:hypothetical protein